MVFMVDSSSSAEDKGGSGTVLRHRYSSQNCRSLIWLQLTPCGTARKGSVECSRHPDVSRIPEDPPRIFCRG